MRNSLAGDWPPGDLDRIPVPAQHNVGEDAALAGRLKCVAQPPALPSRVPRIFALFVQRWGRKAVVPQGLPAIVAGVLAGHPLLVQQGIPVSHEPLEQRQEIPMHVLDAFAVLFVCAEIPALYPKLESTPRPPGVLVLALAGVWIVDERSLHGKGRCVARELFPPNRHSLFSPSCALRRCAGHAPPSPKSVAGCEEPSSNPRDIHAASLAGAPAHSMPCLHVPRTAGRLPGHWHRADSGPEAARPLGKANLVALAATARSAWDCSCIPFDSLGVRPTRDRRSSVLHAATHRASAS